MKKKLAIAAISALSLFSLGGVILGTISWFNNSVVIPKVKVTGNSAGAYFAYGNGNPETGAVDSKDRPYGISHPRHLYNLAWLQYTGFFDDGQYYFELADSVPDEGLDMTGYILPPIGTEDNPFVGNFNGKGKIIKNLTVSNDRAVILSNTNKHPDTNEITWETPEIVGMFGVVGNLGGAYTGSYDTSINTIKDVGISNFTIQANSDKALAGMLAGYVDATVSNVAVNDSTIDVQKANTTCVDSTNMTENISDYGVVGFVTENYKKSFKELQENLYDINISTGHEFNASDEGDSQGWGGSINMKTIYNRIVSLRKTKSTDVSSNGNSTMNWRIDRHYYDGVEKESERLTFNDVSQSNSRNDAYSRFNSFNQATHDYMGSYNVYARAGENGYGADSTYGDQKFLYIAGGHYENRTYRSNTAHEGKYITDGTNYLTIENNQLANTTNASEAVLWTYNVGSSKISAKYQSATTNFWLVNNGGRLTTTNSEGSGTTWTITNTNNKYDITNGNYHLVYVGEWKLAVFYAGKITDGTNFLRYNNGLANSTSSTATNTTWTFATYNGTGRIYLTSGNNTYYLRNNGGTFTTTTNQNQATSWTISSSGGQLTISNNGYYLAYDSGWKLVQFTPYYIIYDNNGHYMKTGNSYYAGYTTDASAATKFNYDTTYRRYYDLSNTNKYLSFYDTSYPVQIYSDGNYPYRLVDENGNLSAQRYGTGYLRAFNQRADTTYQTHYVQYTGSSANNAWTQVTNIANATQMNIDYYSTYQSSLLNPNFTPNISIVSDSSRTGPDTYQTAAQATQSTNESHMYYTATDTTYLPLNVEQDLASYISNTNTMNTEINSGHLDPKDSNTGYIIAGSNIASNAEVVNAQISNIRISRYEIANVSASYNKSSGSTTTINDLPDSSVYTINSAGTHQTLAAAISANPENFGRYADSKTSFFQNSLSTGTTSGQTTTYRTNTYVYGLHFMASTISKNSIVNASKVSVLGNKCGTYQFPVDCIDFNLKQKGSINFFAGTYYDDNDSFFSLHEVFRNNDATGYDSENKTYTSFNTISDIKEIEEIYSTDTATKTTKYANIYKYKGATGNAMYSVPYRIDGNQNKYNMDKNSTTELTTPYTYATMNQTDFNKYVATYGYTLKLKTSQIGKQASAITANRIYYFEFPMNPGEYCLGSVSGGTGAYLLYLDIGANAAKTQRTIIYERYKEVEKVFNYPTGVAIVAVTTVAENISSSTALDEKNTANAVIYAGTNGTLKISRNVNDVTVTRTGGFTTNAKPTLVGDLMWDETHQQYNIHDPGGNNLTSEITSEDTTTEVRILKYLDYNVNLDELMVTWIIDTSTNGGTSFTRTYLQEYANGTSSDVAAEIKVYNTVGGTKYTVDELADQTNLKTVDGTPVTTVLVSFEFVVEDGTDATYDWLLEYEVDENVTTGRYYKFKDYLFEVTVNEGSITFKVLSIGAKTIKIGGVTVTSVGQEITVPTA